MDTGNDVHPCLTYRAHHWLLTGGDFPPTMGNDHLEKYFVLLKMSYNNKIRRSRRISGVEETVKKEERPLNTTDIPSATSTTTSKSKDIKIYCSGDNTEENEQLNEQQKDDEDE